MRRMRDQPSGASCKQIAEMACVMMQLVKNAMTEMLYAMMDVLTAKTMFAVMDICIQVLRSAMMEIW